MDYLGHPNKIAKHITTIPLQINVEKRHALVVQRSLDQHMNFTTVQDIGGVVARAVEYEGNWPVVGGMRGSRVTIRELLKIAERIRGKSSFSWVAIERRKHTKFNADLCQASHSQLSGSSWRTSR